MTAPAYFVFSNPTSPSESILKRHFVPIANPEPRTPKVAAEWPESSCCPGVDMPGVGLVHGAGLCGCGTQPDGEHSPCDSCIYDSGPLCQCSFLRAYEQANAHLFRLVGGPLVDSNPALPQSLDRLTAALDALEAISGELALEDVLTVYARRVMAAGTEPTYSLGLGGESVRCLECDYAHGRHADGCTVGAAQQLLALIWRKRSNQLDKGGEPAESNSRAAVGMRVPEQHHDWISRRFVCVF